MIHYAIKWMKMWSFIRWPDSRRWMVPCGGRSTSDGCQLLGFHSLHSCVYALALLLAAPSLMLVRTLSSPHLISPTLRLSTPTFSGAEAHRSRRSCTLRRRDSPLLHSSALTLYAPAVLDFEAHYSRRSCTL